MTEENKKSLFIWFAIRQDSVLMTISGLSVSRRYKILFFYLQATDSFTFRTRR